MEQAMAPRRLLSRPNSVSQAILPYELIAEIFSWLPVKLLIRFRCVNKIFKTLISDPYFVQMHLNKSSRHSHLALIMLQHKKSAKPGSRMVTLSIPRLLQNQFTIFHDDPYCELNQDYRIVRSCNGLLLISSAFSSYHANWFYFWNPAMRTKSENITIFSSDSSSRCLLTFKLSFGYDNSSGTYKVVAFYVKEESDSEPKIVGQVFSLRDKHWRYIECLPALPLYCLTKHHNTNYNGVHLNGTINWFALRDYFNCDHNSVTVEQYVILSLDLSTETYTQLLLPTRFENVLRHQPKLLVVMVRYMPKLMVLMDRLCFCHDFEETHFIIWQMTNFGVQDSWIQLFKISYENCFGWRNLMPLYLSKNGNTLILAQIHEYDVDEALIYNHRDSRVEKIGIANSILWSHAKDYVESLVNFN